MRCKLKCFMFRSGFPHKSNHSSIYLINLTVLLLTFKRRSPKKKFGLFKKKSAGRAPPFAPYKRKTVQTPPPCRSRRSTRRFTVSHAISDRTVRVQNGKHIPFLSSNNKRNSFRRRLARSSIPTLRRGGEFSSPLPSTNFCCRRS
jgi:hypothetical protein